mmetsp:Transcript_38187/g.126466  ORF Transcript_38187/g.126466 Transcript_38187/m.126466 type:complete len:246 (-) Transcript_38187:113-850(-)
MVDHLELDKVAPFLIKLFEIVSSPASDNLVCWSEHGESFKIVDRTKFAQDVLPLYFKHDNLRSFIRQLNIYGFQRCQNSSGRDRTMEFFHPMFTRNGMRNLKDIKRGNQSKKNDTVEDGVDEVEQPQACPQSLVALLPPSPAPLAAARSRCAAPPPCAPSSAAPASLAQAKRPRVDYSTFKTDVARLQKNLEEFEHDLKQHTLQVQQKLAYILSALDDTPGAVQQPPADSEQRGSSPELSAGALL